MELVLRRQALNKVLSKMEVAELVLNNSYSLQQQLLRNNLLIRRFQLLSHMSQKFVLHTIH